MKRFGALFVVACIAGLWSGSGLLAQQHHQQHRCRAGHGPGMAMHRGQGSMFDPATVQTLKGKVTGIERIEMEMCHGAGVHLMLESDAERISVHLGPAWYLDNQDQTLDVGDEIEVTGSKTTYRGEPAIIAAEVKRGDAVLRLRDERGFPAWRGWRQR